MWEVLEDEYPEECSEKYPPSSKALPPILEKFPTKQSMEEAWAKKNAPNLLAKLEKLVPTLLPTVLLSIVSEYAVTWIAFLRSPPKGQLIYWASEQVPRQLEVLMNEKRYEEVIELCDTIEKDEVAEHLYPLITIVEQCQYLIGYLDRRDMLSSFLTLGNTELVKKTIEFENTHRDYYIHQEDIRDAIVLSLGERDMPMPLSS